MQQGGRPQLFDIVSEVETSHQDPLEKVPTVRAISGFTMLVATGCSFYHIWALVWAIKAPEKLNDTGQTEVVVFIGISIMILISIILLLISWNLLKRVGVIEDLPKEAIRACRRWRRWCACFLAFFITSLMILVLGSGEQVHANVIQNYMAALLILISYTIYGLYYIGKFVNEWKAFHPSGTSANRDVSSDNGVPSTIPTAPISVDNTFLSSNANTAAALAAPTGLEASRKVSKGQ